VWEHAIYTTHPVAGGRSHDLTKAAHGIPAGDCSSELCERVDRRNDWARQGWPQGLEESMSYRPEIQTVLSVARSRWPVCECRVRPVGHGHFHLAYWRCLHLQPSNFSLWR